MRMPPSTAAKVGRCQRAAALAHSPKVVGPGAWPRRAVGHHRSHAVGRVVLEVPRPHLIKVVALCKLHDSSIQHGITLLNSHVHARDCLEVPHAVVVLCEAAEDPVAAAGPGKYCDPQSTAKVGVPSWLADTETRVDRREHAGDPSKDQAQQDEVNCVWEQVLGAEGGQPAAGDKRSPGQQQHQQQGLDAHPNPLRTKRHGLLPCLSPSKAAGQLHFAGLLRPSAS
mmetsp:Transcript_133865/g.317333  ORF Transcript_133865/g.317333 Transcript_133865/m.317333 type:complete len:226 (+) Transcript_133865:334-1011(+)